MPSVRVRRNGGRPYSVLPEPGPDQRPGSFRAPTPSSFSQQSDTAQRRSGAATDGVGSQPIPRRRRGTITSLFSRDRDSGARATSPVSVEGDNAFGSPGRRDGFLATGDADWRRSAVADHIMRSRTVRERTSDQRLLSVDRAQSPPGRSSERRSFGSETAPPVNVRLSREDLEGQVGSALSLPDEGEDDYDEHHHDDIVDHLDVIDPQVATVTHLSNAANSIILPPLSIYSRRPVMNLPTAMEYQDPKEKDQYRDELDRHVDQVLRKRDRFRRIMRGLWDFVSTPVGFCTALYGFLCAFWGAAIVIFLIKIINFHNRDLQNFWIEISSQVTNGLFTATGIGLIPWRVIDTYRMGKILYYKRLTRQLRLKAGLETLTDEDDLPDPVYNPDYVHVLTDEQQDELHYQQYKFAQSQTWYRAHATETHRAFPINTALLICLLIDGNSIFQIILCGCMWGLNRFQRPAWTTGTLIPASFLCAIVAVAIIFRGVAKTKKTVQVEDKLREALQLENEGLMNAHLEERDGFTVVETDKSPPANAETMVIPHAKPLGETTSRTEDTRPDLDAVPSGPASKNNTTEAKESKKAPVLP